ncbi:MAG: response regulator [Planctomycetota bacterium]|nr:response regulator [Planctomycetota bacterium]
MQSPAWEVPELVREAFAILPVAAYVADAEGRIRVWNEQAARFSAYPPASACGRRLQELILPVMAASAGGEQVGQPRALLATADGRALLIDLRRAPLVGSGGEPLGECGTFVPLDPTLHPLGAATPTSFEEAWVRLGDGLWRWDPVRHAVYYSPGWKQQLGYEDHELPQVPETFTDRLHPDDVQPMMQALEACFAGQSPQLRVTCRCRHRDGSWRWILCRGVIVRGERPDDIQLIGVNTDITAQKQLEEELRTAVARAERLAQAKSTFLAHMSHEIRTPLHSLLGGLELVLEGGQLAVEQAEHLHTAYASGQALLELLNDILDFSKLEADALALTPAPCAIHDLVYDTAALFRNRLQPGVELLVRTDPQLPQRIVADAARLRQVLTNLLGNACKFTHHGHILVEAVACRDLLHLIVSDTGIGIPADFLPQLFEPFTQAHSGPTRRYGGTGLGLAICRRLVERMGGRIAVDSTEGVGSTFTVELPLVPDPGSGPLTERRFQGLRVLVLDPHELHASIVVRQLQQLGAQAAYARTAEAGREMHAAAQAAGAGYDVVVIERSLAGAELAGIREWRAQCPNTAFVLCVRDSQPGDQQRCLAAGVTGYVVRPVRPDRLAAIISEALHLARSRQAAVASRVSYWRLPKAPRMPAHARILLAEDHPVIRQVTTLMLQKLGMEVIAVVDGAAASARRFAERFDLVLMDLHMPEMDGLQATQAIRARELAEGWPRVPIIAMTADATHEDRSRCLAAGMDDHLAKPASLESLRAVLLRWLPS